MHENPPPAGAERFAALTADRGILFGGDYNPEQWPRETWRDDVALMQRAGVNLVTVGVFSWAMLEPTPGARDFGWFDEVLDLLHEGGIAVDLATPTASPPPWLGIRHPETLPVDRDGVRLVAGSRNQFAPASRVYRAAALAITRDLAERYRDHPAVRMWHVGNEFGQLDHGNEAARSFRDWLRARYGTIDALNAAWGTAFWSQRYADFDEILPPRRAPYLINPTQSLDFRRYTSDELRACYRELRDAIRATGAAQPITTNFMGPFHHADYWTWADDVDVVSDDQYPDPADPDAPADIAFAQDLVRGLGGGAPWVLMEQAISAVQWRPHNLPKTPARARLDSLQAVARGADGICFFQWRQSTAGSEAFHSAMLPHAGADTDVFAGVCRQGADLQRLRPVVGGRIAARTALLWDWPSWWAADEPARPTTRLDSLAETQRWYRALWRRDVAVDVVRHGADLSAYDVVIVPHAYLLEPNAASALADAAARGAQVVIGAFSGVADRNAHVLAGRSPALLREMLGASGEEWAGLPDGGVPVALAAPALAAAGGSDAAPFAGAATAGILADKLRSDGAEVRATFASGDLAGRPVITRHGGAWHVAAVLGDDLLDHVIGEVLAAARVAGAVDGLPPHAEAVRRGDALFLLNRGDAPVVARVPGTHTDLLTDETMHDLVTIAPWDARVLIERHTP
ncbi:beta-galactosidase [Microbacterium telephonicum]|uniref:Beta-galactosidase n=1 Tax=Microbacterium telephonicum TaxID=1714841 RepID=A0A498CAZ4_9MICO|nr:beta-galactosidase [Microbacterium telephonicum]RLK52663.1 beta-galactosidase [Microbacterium telephonicum]